MLRFTVTFYCFKFLFLIIAEIIPEIFTKGICVCIIMHVSVPQTLEATLGWILVVCIIFSLQFGTC